MGAVFSRLARIAAADFGIQWSCFAVAAALQTEKFYDFSGSCTYIYLVLAALRRARARQGGKLSLRQMGAAGATCVWAGRLGTFLLQRVLHDDGDRRFDKVRSNPRIFFVYWSVQALWVFLTALPTYMILSVDDVKRSGGGKDAGSGGGAGSSKGKARKEERGGAGPRDKAGAALWVLGFALQVTADRQKSAFLADAANRGKFITGGLWSCSQHPNYFGEMAMWAGVWLGTSSSFRGLEHVAAISPLFVYHLLTKVSGIPLLRKRSMQKWGHLPEYLEHVRKTPLLLPVPPFMQ